MEFQMKTASLRPRPQRGHYPARQVPPSAETWEAPEASAETLEAPGASTEALEAPVASAETLEAPPRGCSPEPPKYRSELLAAFPSNEKFRAKEPALGELDRRTPKQASDRQGCAPSRLSSRAQCHPDASQPSTTTRAQTGNLAAPSSMPPPWQTCPTPNHETQLAESSPRAQRW